MKNTYTLFTSTWVVIQMADECDSILIDNLMEIWPMPFTIYLVYLVFKLLSIV